MPNNCSISLTHRFLRGGLLVASLLLAAFPTAIAADDQQIETIDATAMGTSIQMGQSVGVKVTIYHFSSPEDRQTLADAFKKGKSRGLADALSKMKPVGRIAITGTLGYDLSYIAPSSPPLPAAGFGSPPIARSDSVKPITPVQAWLTT
jgi:hypothetical protein